MSVHSPPPLEEVVVESAALVAMVACVVPELMVPTAVPVVPTNVTEGTPVAEDPPVAVPVAVAVAEPRVVDAPGAEAEPPAEVES